MHHIDIQQSFMNGQSRYIDIGQFLLEVHFPYVAAYFAVATLAASCSSLVQR